MKILLSIVCTILMILQVHGVNNDLMSSIQEEATVKGRVYRSDLTTGQKFDNLPPDNEIEPLEVGY